MKLDTKAVMVALQSGRHVPVLCLLLILGAGATLTAQTTEFDAATADVAIWEPADMSMTSFIAEPDPEALLAVLEPVTLWGQLVRLPVPRLPAGPVVMRPARAFQVSFTVLPVAKINPSKLQVANTTPVAATPIVVTPLIAKPIIATPIARTTYQPVQSKIKAPVPIQRTSTPVTTIQEKNSQPSPSASPVAFLTPVSDAHSQSDYKLVQLPAATPLPTPVSSLPVLSQEITGTQGQTVSVRLSGRGWMFAGTGKTPAGVSFIEKTVQQDAEQFKFRLDEIGNLSLQFQRQDVASGLMERQLAALTVQARGTTAAKPTLTVNAAASSNQYQPEFPVFQERAISKAVPTVSRPVTVASANLPDQSVAFVASVAEEAVPTDAAGFLALAKRRDQAKQFAAALDIYEKILKDFPAFTATDEVLFRQAKNLESASDSRNLRRAYDLYVKLQGEFPYSAFVDQAKERARYINRTYFRQ